MTAQVLSFKPRSDVLPRAIQAESGAPAAPISINPEPIAIKREPLIRDPRVVMPLSVLEEMTDALVFYSRSGFDHGVIARSALSGFQPQPGASA